MSLGLEEIIDVRAIKELVKRYNPLDYTINLANLLKTVYPLKNFDKCSKYELHLLLNDTIFQNYKGEEILKYILYSHHIEKPDLVAAFEIKVNNSRVDFLTINGSTTSFEIKSELDNLSKVKKQMADYLLAFEYNYLVVDEKHAEKAKEFLPTNFGLWLYKEGKCHTIRIAGLNDKMNPEIQLCLLTKRELLKSFPESAGIVKNILRNYDARNINFEFKKILKLRYKARWEFLLANNKQIFPVDLQFFFNTNIAPDHIYYR